MIVSEWISAEDRLPESNEGYWSSMVEAKCNLGFIYNLSYFNGSDSGCWQRTSSFVRRASDKIVQWRLLIHED